MTEHERDTIIAFMLHNSNLHCDKIKIVNKIVNIICYGQIYSIDTI